MQFPEFGEGPGIPGPSKVHTFAATIVTVGDYLIMQSLDVQALPTVNSSSALVMVDVHLLANI